jgi:outer membrane protein insertion porin family
MSLLSPGPLGRRLRRAVVAGFCVWAGGPGLAAAAPQVPALPGAAFVGRPVTRVEVEMNGRVVTDPVVRELVETRAGEPLSLVQVRETIGHLFALGRYQDIAVEALLDGAGVALRYRLVPLQVVRRVAFRGSLGLRASALRRALEARLGRAPLVGRAAAAAQVLEEVYARTGYLRARVTPRVQAGAEGGGPELVFEVDAGPRARVGAAVVTGSPLEPPASVLARLDVRPGAFYDRTRLDRALERYVAGLKHRGHLQASATVTPTVRADGTVVDLLVEVRPGPVVTVRVVGDPLPADRLAELVPVAREGTVDEDLLEDSDERIRAYLHEQGYRDAAVSHQRVERDGRLEILFQVRRGPLFRVADVAIEGNRAVPTSELRGLLRVKPGEPFVAARLDADVAAIESHYRRLGYAGAKVTPEVDADTRGARAGLVMVTPRVTVEEGPRTIVTDVRFEGVEAGRAVELGRVLQVGPGAPFDAARVAADRDALTVWYLNRGFQAAEVRVAPAFREDRTGVELRYTIREGPQAIVDHILVVGNTRTQTSTIARELAVRPGEPLGLAALVESQRRLSALGLFRRVRLTTIEHGAAGRRDLVVIVEEAPATTLGVGGGVEGGRRLRAGPDGGPAIERIEVAPRGFFEVGRRNLWGRNRSVNLFTRVSVRPSDRPTAPGEPQGRFTEYRVTGLYREPQVFGLAGVDLVGSAFLEQGVRTSFNFSRKGVNAELVERLTPATRLSARYSVNYTRRFDERIDPAEQSLIDRLFPQVRLSALSSTIFYDTRDDAVDPGRGAWASVDGEVALRGLGSEVGFAKTYLQGFLYRRLPAAAGRRTVVAFGARVGLARGFPREVELGAPGAPRVVTRVEDVPASERFFAGGDTTVRGFTLDRLGAAGTLDPNGFPKGGNGLLVLNAELRVGLWRSLGAVAFVDAGNVFARVRELSLAEIRPSAGVGLRYQSPIGPLRVDLGVKLDRRPGERLTALHFSFGQAF